MYTYSFKFRSETCITIYYRHSVSISVTGLCTCDRDTFECISVNIWQQQKHGYGSECIQLGISRECLTFLCYFYDFQSAIENNRVCNIIEYLHKISEKIYGKVWKMWRNSVCARLLNVCENGMRSRRWRRATQSKVNHSFIRWLEPFIVVGNLHFDWVVLRALIFFYLQLDIIQIM